MSQIKVIPLGAGQDVGRSCIVVSIGGKNIMFDCGMHMGYNDERRFPNFKYISPSENYDEVIDCVIISHFHLDHCGALPYFTEMCGYTGPVYMTYPTRAVCPILLEDFRKITTERKGETNFFTSDMIKASMKKVIAVDIQQTIKVDDDLEIKAFYAGHVLGAAMFYVKAGDQSCLYTGDYNMTPDRHLGSAKIDKLRVDLLITETTYATTIRDSKRLREREFLKNCHETVARGGKVLIPVFALGRAQELCILIESYWERMNLSHVPVYFSAGLVERANLYYKLFINWTNQKIKSTFVQHNMFDLKHIKPFDKSIIEKPGPCVLFATPGMLHAGTSLEVFKKWCGDELNTCILPGFCVAGTVGNKILSKNKRIEVDKKTIVDVNCQVKSLSFSAHADAKGIMTLIQQCEPKNVMLVHGEKSKMQFLKKQIMDEFKIPCFDPANGEVLTVNLYPDIPLNISRSLIKRENNDDLHIDNKKARSERLDIEGVLVMDQSSQDMKLLHPDEAQRELGITQHQLTFVKTIPLEVNFEGIYKAMINEGCLEVNDTSLRLKSISISQQDKELKFSWSYKDEDLATKLMDVIKTIQGGELTRDNVKEEGTLRNEDNVTMNQDEVISNEEVPMQIES